MAGHRRIQTARSDQIIKQHAIKEAAHKRAIQIEALQNIVNRRAAGFRLIGDDVRAFVEKSRKWGRGATGPSVGKINTELIKYITER